LACASSGKILASLFSHIRATIGFDAKTAIFSVVNTVLLKPLSYVNADRLVNFLFSASGIADNLHCVAEFHFFERQSNLFKESWLSTTPAQALPWAGSSRPEQLFGIYRRLGNLEESKKALDSFTRLDQENNELEKTRRNISKTRGAPHPGGERVQ